MTWYVMRWKELRAGKGQKEVFGSSGESGKYNVT